MLYAVNVFELRGGSLNSTDQLNDILGRAIRWGITFLYFYTCICRVEGAGGIGQEKILLW